MQGEKWGTSLAMRLPTAVVDALALKEGDHIESRVADQATIEVRRDRHDAPDRLRKLRRSRPPGSAFDRDEANTQ